ncbi:hypothetical protein KBF38_23850 [bacterium]|nr:hypothetical protein [bacterium]
MFEVTRLKDGPRVKGPGNFSVQLNNKLVYEVPVYQHDYDDDKKRTFKKGCDLSDVEAVEIAVILNSAP